MSDKTCFLITVLYHGSLLKCALEVKLSAIGDDCFTYPMEPENREILHKLLPLHVQSCGPIVNVERIFAVQAAR